MSEALQKKKTDEFKRRIGKKVRQLRGERSKLWVETQSGVDRGILGAIELGTRDYRIGSLLKVIATLSPEDPVQITLKTEKTA